MTVLVAGTTRTPLPFGLFSVLTSREGTQDPHWQNGIRWEALTCTPANGIGAACPPDGGDVIGLPKQIDASDGIGEASPFTIYGHFTCSPVGFEIGYAQQRATEHLLTREESRVEQALWTGDLGNEALLDQATDLGTGSAVEVLGRLEQWIAAVYGSMGVLHTDRATATALLGADLVVARGNSLYTGLGTPVIAGSGYGTEADPGRLVISPPLLAYRSEVFPGASPVSAGFDRATNDLSAVAERTYVVGWDPCGTATAVIAAETP